MPKVPERLKLEVTTKANQLVEEFFKPRFVLPPPENPQFNYCVDLFTKWHGKFFYFSSTYRCPSPNCISEYFEAKWARLEHASGRYFHLAFMRHTGQFWTLYSGLTLEDCLKTIQEDEMFHL